MEACIDEFSSHGYLAGSTDRIIRKAGISKGGLYEYISTKKELYLASVRYAYDQIYGYLHERIESVDSPLPKELIQRLRVVNEYAAEVYLQNPDSIALLAGAATEREEDLKEELAAIFQRRFDSLFGDVETEEWRYPRERIFELVRTLLVKTRNEFLNARQSQRSDKVVAAEYLQSWEFYLGVLSQGIFTHP